MFIDCVTNDFDRCLVLEPKHDIFLGHSGKEKDFTELLYWELKNCGYNPFFDKDPYSLPEGKDFSELIFNVAKQCPVAIFILSEDFFTNSKWPMLELAAFVESHEQEIEKKKCGKEYQEIDLIPILFKDFSRESIKENRQKWFKRWQGFKSRSKIEANIPMIDIAKWEHALDVLLKRRWIAYTKTNREHGLIKEIVNGVRRSLPPPNPLSDGNVQGIERIRQVRNKFVE